MKKLGVAIAPKLWGQSVKAAPWQLSEAAKRDIVEIEHNARTALDRINASGWPYNIPRAASAGRNQEGHDPEEGHGRNDEHAVLRQQQTPEPSSRNPDHG